MSGGSGATSQGGNPQIVGGSDATPLEFPWQISLRISGQHICGGSIINKQHILTAAHCILEGYTSAYYYTVVVGDQKLDTVDPNEKTFSVQSYTIHPKWNRATVNYDYAILKLKTPLDFSGAQKALMPICLPEKNQVFDNRTCTATGWGYLKDKSMGGGTVSNVLQKVDLPTVPYNECKNDYKNVNTVVEDTMICAGPKEGGKSACQVWPPPGHVQLTSVLQTCGFGGFEDGDSSGPTEKKSPGSDTVTFSTAAGAATAKGGPQTDVDAGCARRLRALDGVGGGAASSSRMNEAPVLGCQQLRPVSLKQLNCHLHASSGRQSSAASVARLSPCVSPGVRARPRTANRYPQTQGAGQS
ncbi:putative serine protease [Ixodes scapularis]